MSNKIENVVNTPNIKLDAFLPVLIGRLSGVPDKSDFKVLAPGLEKYINEQIETVTLIDLRDVKKLKMLAASSFWVPWATRHVAALNKLSAGAVLVSGSSATAKVVNAVLKLMPVSTPMLMVNSMDEALDWLYANASNLDLPDRAALSDMIDL